MCVYVCDKCVNKCVNDQYFCFILFGGILNEHIHIHLQLKNTHIILYIFSHNSNHSELQTVGWSNLFSGLTGGFTGSYIFTQTIFSLRRGVDSRLCGFICGTMELGTECYVCYVRCYFDEVVNV